MKTKYIFPIFVDEKHYEKIFAFFISLTLVSCISVEQYNKNLENLLKQKFEKRCRFCL
jgi:hypothetical protein